MARYRKDHRRVVLEYKYRELPKMVVVWSDTDFAGCGRTRKSTSGGVVMFGSRCLKTHIALSSGESDFYGIVKAATRGIGIKSMFKDPGLEVEIQVNTDSSAARSISSRMVGARLKSPHR